MARESPPTRRVTAVLGAVAAEPGSALSLAELSRRTGISKATCLGIVNELCDTGWLARDGDAKAYRCGPAMLAAGVAAQESYASVQAVRPHLARLAARTGLPCTASAVVEGQVSVLARADAGPDTTSAFRVGRRYPFAPPSGVMFVAWDDDAAVEAWLRREPLPPLRSDVEQLREVVRACREQGHLVVGLGEVNAGLYALLDQVGDDQLAGRLGELLSRAVPANVQPYLTGELRDDRTYDVSLVCAPVYNADARMELLVAVLLMRSGVPAGQLEQVIAALAETTEEVTRELRGRDPWPRPASG